MAKGDRFKLLIKFIKSVRTSRGYDCCIAISGAEQSGKSTLAVQIVQALQDGKIDLEKNIGYRTSECMEEIKTIPQNGCYILDEAIRAFYKRDWNLGTHKELNRIFAQIGMKKAVFIFNIPNFLDLDKFYRNHRVRIWIHVLGNRWDKELNKPDLFYAVVFLKDTSPSNPDPWFLATEWQGRKKLIQNGKEFPLFFTDSIPIKIEHMEKNPCFKWHFTYRPLQDPIWKKYSAMSAKRKMDIEAVETSNKYKRAFHNVALNLEAKDGFTPKKIAGYTAPLDDPDSPEVSKQTVWRITKSK